MTVTAAVRLDGSRAASTPNAATRKKTETPGRRVAVQVQQQVQQPPQRPRSLRFSPRFGSLRNREPLAWVADPHPQLGKNRKGRGGGPPISHRIFLK